MIYSVKIFVKGQKKPEAEIECGDQYLQGLKKDLFDNEVKFLDLEREILPKDSVSKIEIEKTSEN